MLLNPANIAFRTNREKLPDLSLPDIRVHCRKTSFKERRNNPIITPSPEDWDIEETNAEGSMLLKDFSGPDIVLEKIGRISTSEKKDVDSVIDCMFVNAALFEDLQW